MAPSALPSMLKKQGIAQTASGPRVYTVVDEVVIEQWNAPDKALALHLLEWADDKSNEIRSGYYLFQDDQWRWARWSQMAPTKDFARLAKEAARKGWIRL